LSPAPSRDKAEPAFRKTEYGFLGSDAYIAGERNLKSAPESRTVDSGNKRFPKVHTTHGSWRDGTFPEPIGFHAGEGSGNIGASAKSAVTCPGNDSDPKVVIITKIEHSFAELFRKLGVHGIESIRTIDGENGNPAVFPVVDGHRTTS